MTGPRETVYDAEIAPLMAQIIEITKRSGIPMHASFKLDGDLTCTSHSGPLKGRDEHEQRWADIYDPIAVGVKRSVSPLMATLRDERGATMPSSSLSHVCNLESRSHCAACRVKSITAILGIVALAFLSSCRAVESITANKVTYWTTKCHPGVIFLVKPDRAAESCEWTLVESR